MTYKHLTQLCLFSTKAQRENEFETFIYAHGQMCHVFFVIQSPNCLWWMVRYFLSLSNVNDMLDGTSVIFWRWCFVREEDIKLRPHTALSIWLSSKIVFSDAYSSQRLTNCIWLSNFCKSWCKLVLLDRQVRGPGFIFVLMLHHCILSCSRVECSALREDVIRCPLP